MKKQTKQWLEFLLLVGAIFVMGILISPEFRVFITDLAIAIIGLLLIPFLLVLMALTSSNNPNSDDDSDVRSKTEELTFIGGHKTTIYEGVNSYAEGFGNTPEESQENARLQYEKYKQY
jgi:hypothetical protein